MILLSWKNLTIWLGSYLASSQTSVLKRKLASWLTGLWKEEDFSHLYSVCRVNPWTFLLCSYPSGKRVFSQSLSPYSDSSFLGHLMFCSILAGILADIPWQLNPLSTQDTYHWAALARNCFLEIAWSLKIQAYQERNFMMFKTELKSF